MYKILQMFIILVLFGCGDIRQSNHTTGSTYFTSSFESSSDFSAYYSVAQGEYDSTHEYSAENVHDGLYAHKATILRARDSNNDGWEYKPHRAYPTIQFHKTSGVYKTPVLVSLWVYLDISLSTRSGIDDWFSFITLSHDASDDWCRTVVVNVTPDGYIKLVHVPNQGEQNHIYQLNASNDSGGTHQFPYREWVRLDVFIDFDPNNGYAKLWQNGTLISHAYVKGGNGGLAQAHFGLYAAAAISSGTVYNDKLRIKEVSSESEAQSLVDGTW